MLTEEGESGADGDEDCEEREEIPLLLPTLPDAWNGDCVREDSETCSVECAESELGGDIPPVLAWGRTWRAILMKFGG